MDYISKIKKVRENIQEWQKEHGNEFSYMVFGFYSENETTGETSIIISPEEQEEIVEYLARRKFFEIIKKTKNSFQVKVLPKKKSIVKLKTLELISRELKDHYTGYDITKLLEGCGVEKKLIIYPTSKWFIFYSLFEELAIAQDEKAKELIFKIICEAIHPLNLGGNMEMSNKLVKKFNDYLKYDNLGIFYLDKEQKYEISNINNLIEVDEKELTQDFRPLIEEILPDINKSTFSEKVIELIAQVFNNNLSNSEIRKIITPILNKNEPISKEPFTKGYIDDWLEEHNWLYNLEKVLDFIKRKDENADKTIAEIIEALLHPLNYNADEEKAEKIAELIGKYLRYDRFYIQDIGEEYLVLSGKEMEEMHSFSPEFEEEEMHKKEEDNEKIKNSKEIIKQLRDTHQAYIDIIEIFCGNTKKPTRELNDAYLFLSNKIEKIVRELGLKTYYNLFYRPFKDDLYSAEIEWKNRENHNERLSWDAIRPILYRVHSEITKLLNLAEENTYMTDEEKKLEDITKLISEKRTPPKIEPKPVLPPMKIEISKMPDLNVKNIDNNFIRKNNKRITLPKFPRTDWLKVSITFLGERDILLSDGKNTKPSSFEGLGCDDGRNGRPDDNWDFFLNLTKNDGQTFPVAKKEREKKKKQKQKITDIMRKIFDNDTDPFEKETGGIYKAKFNIKYTNNEKIPESGKYSDLQKVFSEMTEPIQNDIDSEFSQ